MWYAIYGDLSLNHDTPSSFRLNRRRSGEHTIGAWHEELHRKLMNRDLIFKRNTSKTVTYDVGEYVSSFVGGMGS
jgi:hypothetical protein